MTCVVRALVLVTLCVSFAACSPAGKNRRTADTHLTVCNKDRSITDDPSLVPFFNRHPANGSSLKVCTADSSCCTQHLEKKFLELVGSNYESLLWRHSQSLYHLLKSTEDAVEEHVLELVHQSENKTLTVFHQVYQSMSVLATDSVTKMYSSILRQATSRDRPTYDADIAVLDFFQDVFPLVYHNIVNPRLRDYSRLYKKCLRDAWHEIKPYGEIPRDLAAKVDQTMSSVRIFLQALRVGSGALNKTLQVSIHPRCREELVRMSLCPWCQNVNVRPCSGYCLNVMRGCLTHFSSVLDLPWSGFVDALEQLLSRQISSGPSNLPINQLVSRLDEVVRSLDMKISEAIMKAMMEGTHLEEKAKKICGAPSWSDDDSQPPPPEVIMQPDMLEPSRIKVTPHSAGKRFSEKLRESEKRVSTELQHFLDNIGKFQTYFGSMAENVCSDESFAHTRDTFDCWNGHRVGEYSKTVVAAGVSAQKYNPELPLIDDVSDPDIRDLSDHLRTMRQVIMSQLIRQPESDSFMRDEEGSGGGDIGVVPRYPGDDEETWDGNEGSGSGDSPVGGGFTEYPRSGVDVTRTAPKNTTGRASLLLPSVLQLTIAAILSHRYLLGL